MTQAVERNLIEWSDQLADGVKPTSSTKSRLAVTKGLADVGTTAILHNEQLEDLTEDELKTVLEHIREKIKSVV